MQTPGPQPILHNCKIEPFDKLVSLNPPKDNVGPFSQGKTGPTGRRGKAGRRGRPGPPGDAMVGALQKDDKCNEDKAGLLRFNSTSSGQKLLFCDGQRWKVSVCPLYGCVSATCIAETVHEYT